MSLRLSAASTPLSICVKYESTISTRGGRTSTSPIALARDRPRERAAMLGAQPSSPAAARTFARVCSDTPGRPLSAYDTAASDTPAWVATCRIVTRRERAALSTITEAYKTNAPRSDGHR